MAQRKSTPKSKFVKPAPFEYNGVTINFKKNPLNNVEVLDDFRIAASNPLYFSSFIKTVVGEDQFVAVMDALRDKDGDVSVEAADSFIAAMASHLAPN